MLKATGLDLATVSSSNIHSYPQVTPTLGATFYTIFQVSPDRLPPGGRLYSVSELGDLVIDRTALGHQLADLPIGMHNGRVIATPEGLADLRQRELG